MGPSPDIFLKGGGALFTTLLAAGLLALAAPRPDSVVGDARRGVEVFRAQKCVTCHSVNGLGGKSAPDLGQLPAKSYAPSDLAGRMWNHAPRMWAALEQAGIERPRLTAQQAADLFAYFAAARYFDAPGEAGRGRALLASKGCLGCHAAGGHARPLADSPVAEDPILFARAMWNHKAGGMKPARGKRGWPDLSEDEVGDILAFLRPRSSDGAKAMQFAPADPEAGRLAFGRLGCVTCHRIPIATRLDSRTLTGFAAGLWNHVHGGMATPALTEPQMRRITGYLWAEQYFDKRGAAAPGRQVFLKKRCDDCHGPATVDAPRLAPRGTARSSVSMVQSLWEHGPAMVAELERQKIPWPQFRETEMADLIAYLNSLKYLHTRAK